MKTNKKQIAKTLENAVKENLSCSNLHTLKNSLYNVLGDIEENIYDSYDLSVDEVCDILLYAIIDEINENL